ncbi:hypothetical protein AB0H17_09015 [Streptomyces olivoreticuli]
MVGAEQFEQIAFGGRAGGGDDAGAGVERVLQGREADAAGRPVDEDGPSK